MQYEVIVSSVHSRSDLLDRTMRSMLPRLDQKPERILIHEDAKQSEPYVKGRTEAIVEALQRDFGVPIVLHQQVPGRGLGRAMLWLFKQATTEFVLYTQEDFDFLRPVPVGECLSLMASHKLNHVRFNKRKTLKVKGAHNPDPKKHFHKIEVKYGEQTFCVSDHWYFQLGLWRRSIALEGFEVICGRTAGLVDHCEHQYNHWFNTHPGYGAGADSINGAHRLTHCGTYIWGGIGEPAFIQHTGHDRRSQDWPENAKRDPNS